MYAYGRGAVIKIPDRSTPDGWIETEAAYTAAVHAAGAPAPELLGLEQVAGRCASVWERVRGPTLWECAVDRPDRCAEYGAVVADLQLALFTLVPSVVLPRQRDRLVNKIRGAARLVDRSLGAALALLPSEVRPLRVCHGDLHPGNVILSGSGPVAVDWFDASRGDPIADVARSALLMAFGGAPDAPRHLPGATRETLGLVSAGYRARLRSRMDVCDARLDQWHAVEAVAQLAEGGPRSDPLEVWERFAAAADGEPRSGDRRDGG